MFDPEAFGRAMGEAIRKAVEPLQAKIAELENQLKAQPKDGKDGAPGRDGKDCDMEAVKTMISEAVKAIPGIPGKDGAPGNDGAPGAAGKDCDMEAVKIMVAEVVKSIPVVHGKDGAPGRDGVDGAPGRDGVSVTVKDIEGLVKDEVRNWTEGLPIPKDGKNGTDGKDGERGEKGADGIGLAGAMIDRDGNLMATLTNGEVKNLGPVVGKDGKDGKDGTDGIGFDSFDMEYIPESHEIAIKATAAGRVKELRYPAGGIRPAGYWREGTKAKAGEAWTHDGSLWIATKDTSTKPETAGSDWVIGARKGRDGERGQKGLDGAPPAPIKLDLDYNPFPNVKG